ncbi:MAG: hypothetical protein JWM64_1615 [Frankiales bacterium]|nr:hypothetical protein [Frankiales bacterium]
MRRTTRFGSALLLATAVGPVLAVAPASAAPTSESASSAGYFSAAGPQDTGTPAGTPPDVGTMADGVAAGNLAVQGGAGQEQKVSFLLFPGQGLQPGATVASATLTVPLAEGDGNLQASPAPEKVRVCAVDDTGFGGEDGAALAVAPKRLCDVFSAPGKASTDEKSYVFDVTALAQRWTEANDGLALTAAEGATTAPFQVVFASGDQARLAYTATAPAQETAVAPAAAAPAAGDGAGSGTAETPALEPGSDLGAPASDSSSDAGTDVSEAPVTAPLEAAPADVGLTAVPGSVPVAESAPAPRTAVEPVAAARPTVVREPTLTPGAPFWAGLAAMAGLLALVSLVLGDQEVSRQDRPTSRLALALQSRQQAGAADDRAPGLTLRRA